MLNLFLVFRAIIVPKIRRTIMKKILSLFLCFIVAISAVGCNGDREPNTSDNTNSSNSEVTENSDTTSSEDINSSADNSEENASGTVEIFGCTYDINETTSLCFEFTTLRSISVFREAMKTEESAQQAFNDTIEEIKKLKNLEAIAFVNGEAYMKYIDLSFLEEIPQLKVLILTGCQITDYEVIGKLTNLETLGLSDYLEERVDITPLANLTNLKEVAFPSVAKDAEFEEETKSWLKENLPNCKLVYKILSYKWQHQVGMD